MPKKEQPRPQYPSKGDCQRIKIMSALPGSTQELVLRTGYSKDSIDRHIAILREQGIVALAYKACPPGGIRVVSVYGVVGKMPTPPDRPEKPKKEKPTRPMKPVPASPYRTIWQGRNPFETAY